MTGQRHARDWPLNRAPTNLTPTARLQCVELLPMCVALPACFLLCFVYVRDFRRTLGVDLIHRSYHIIHQYAVDAGSQQSAPVYQDSSGYWVQ